MERTLKEFWNNEIKKIAVLKNTLQKRKRALAQVADILVLYQDDIAYIEFNYMDGIHIAMKTRTNYRALTSKLARKFGALNKSVIDQNYSGTINDDKVFLRFETQTLDPFISLEVENPSTCTVVYEEKVVPAHQVEETTNLVVTIECK